MNEFIALGRIATEIELKYKESGVVSTSFLLAISRGKDRNGEDRGADCPRITAFGVLAENLHKYSGKGKRILISAHIHTERRIIDNGEKIYYTNIIADSINFIDWKNDEVSDSDTGFYDDELYRHDEEEVI